MDLCVTEHSIHDSKIEAIYDHTKKNLDAFKEKWSKSTFNTEEYDRSFNELIICIKSSFTIMSTVFQHIIVRLFFLDLLFHIFAAHF